MNRQRRRVSPGALLAGIFAVFTGAFAIHADGVNVITVGAAAISLGVIFGSLALSCRRGGGRT
jgi:hypothetical protein